MLVAEGQAQEEVQVFPVPQLALHVPSQTGLVLGQAQLPSPHAWVAVHSACGSAAAAAAGHTCRHGLAGPIVQGVETSIWGSAGSKLQSAEMSLRCWRPQRTSSSLHGIS